MPVSDVLKNFRGSGYSQEPEGKEKGGDGPRVIRLTDDEMKEVSQYANAKPGEEVTCEISGRLEKDGHFHVMSVRPTGGGMNEEKDMAAEVAGQPPMSRMQVAPSPS